MGKNSEPNIEAAPVMNELVDLQRLMYRAILAGSALLHGLALSYALIAQTLQSPFLIAVCALVGGTSALMWRLNTPADVGRPVFAVLHVAELAACILTAGWPPLIVWLAMFLSIAVGALLGRRGVWVFSASLFVVFAAGALLVPLGFSIEVSVGQPSEPEVWIRVGLLHLCVVGGMAFVTRYLISLIVAAGTRSDHVHATILTQQQALETTRRSRSATELQIGGAQKIHSLAHLARGLAHLVNNTLTVVRTGAERLADVTTPTETRSIAQGVTKAVQRCSAAVSDILAFSRRAAPERREVYIQAELEDFQGVLEKSVRQNTELRVQTDDLPPVMADPLRLRQAIFNLVLNARAATDSGGTITIMLRSQRVDDAGVPGASRPLLPGRYAVVTVEDNGTGMEASALGRAMEPFFTTRSSDTHEGLGLTVVRNVVESFDGAVVLDSAPGAGTRAALYMPLVAPCHTDLPDSGATPEPTRSPMDNHAPARAVVTDYREDWTRPSAERNMRRLTFLCAIATATTLFLGTFQDIVSISLGIAVTVICLATLLSPKPTTFMQFGVVMTIIITAAGFVIIRNTFMTPVAMTALATSVLLCATYTNKALTLGALLLSASLFFVLPIVSDLQSWNDANVDTGISLNWLRIGLLWPVVLLFNASLVLDVLDVAEQRIQAVNESVLEMRQLRVQRADEDEALLRAQRTAERSTRVEATGRAVGVVAHDINNALTSVLGWSALLEAEPAISDDDRAEAVIAFERSVVGAAKLATQLRPMQQGNPKDNAVLELAAEVQGAKRRIRQLLPPAISVTYDLNRGGYASVGRVDLERILVNLVSNARDAMGESGALTIRCRHDVLLDEAVLEIADAGPGIDEALQERVFDPYFTTKPAESGTGLGLYSVRNMVESSGGRVFLESRAGCGTTITIRWPQADYIAPAATIEQPATSTERPTSPILLAEDDYMVRRVLEAGLRREGFNIVTAVDGSDALVKLAEREDWAGLCTDAVMPGTPVDEVYRSFRRRFPDRPVLLVSGHVPEEFEAMRDAPDVRFLGKPVSPSDVSRVLLEEMAQRDAAARSGRDTVS